MGMIRVSDHAEKIIKEQANGRTISATVDALIAGGGRNLDKEYFDNKFREQQEALRKMRSLIEDTAVDRLSSGGRNFSSASSASSVYQDPLVKQALLRTDIEWPIVQELIYGFLDKRAPEWFPGMYEAVHEMNDAPECFTKNSILYFDITGSPYPVLRVSPRVDQFLAEKIESQIESRE